jgi:glycosyltransferase involved in cell wall biosynthesis
MKPTILYLHTTSEIGGADVSLLHLVAGLDAARYRRIVLLPAAGPLVAELEGTGAEVRLVPALKKLTRRRGRWYLAKYLANYPRAVAAVAALVRREQVDLVHTNTLHCLYGFAAARITRRPHVWHVREIVWQSAALRRLEVALARRFARRLVVPSRAVAEMFRDGAGRLPPQLVTIPNGVDPTVFHPGRDGTRVRASLGVGADEALVGLVCRLDPWKGVETFLDAAARCQPSGRTRFVVVGGPIEGHERYPRELEARARALGLDGRLRFTGWRFGPREMPEVMAALDVCVLASVRPEPFGRVLLEAMATARPVVASDLGGPREICVHGETGWLVPPGDARALAEAVTALVADPARARAFGWAGRRRVEAHFDGREIARRIAALYEVVLSEDPGPGAAPSRS